MTKLQTKTNIQNPNPIGRQQMNIVMIGHVDHGKSTVIGRLLADTDSLPKGKLEEVKNRCRQNARPFEYAFLLDALKDEQAQGITIDSARCFFKTAKRQYIIIDAPGHIEFLKNMISGAARAEAALLVIDAEEGIKENSRRHGYLLGMLGIKQIAVCVNKMDLVDYDQNRFDSIVAEYSRFLEQINLKPAAFLPISAREGDNISSLSQKTDWYKGLTVLQMLDDFQKEAALLDKPFRFPVQDIYKFTAQGDDRRIAAGRIETGSVNLGDEVAFWPSGKRSRIASIEQFNAAVKRTASAGESVGFTLDTQIYIQPGELMTRTDAPPKVSSQIKVNIFWMGRHPMIKGKRYKLKIAAAEHSVWLRKINTVLDASELTTDANREQIERHDVAECILETLKPTAFDLSGQIAQTGRFVIIDNYEIAGGGIVLDSVEATTDRIREHVQRREHSWRRSALTTAMRSSRYGQKSAMVLITGPEGQGKSTLAQSLEANLFNSGRVVYYLGLSNSLLAIDNPAGEQAGRDEYLRNLGEAAHLFTDAGVILITTVSDLDDYELAMLKTLNQPNECVVINIGQNRFSKQKIDLQVDDISDKEVAISKIKKLLQTKNYLIEYYV